MFVLLQALILAYHQIQFHRWLESWFSSAELDTRMEVGQKFSTKSGKNLNRFSEEPGKNYSIFF